MVRVLLALVLALMATEAAAQDVDNAGLFRSDDDGQSWAYLETSPPVATVYGLWLDSGVPGRMIAATDQSLWLTEDDGVSWRPIGGDGDLPADVIAYAITADPEQPERLWAGTEIGVVHSPDAGATWFPVGDPGPPAVAILALPGPVGTLLYAGTADGLRGSEDDGQSWVADAPGLEGAVLSLGFGPEGDLLVGTTTGLYTRALDEPEFSPARGMPRAVTRAVAFGDDGFAYAAVGSTIYQRDAGWTKLATLPLASNGDTPIVGSLLVNVEGRVLAGTDRGLHRSPDWSLAAPFDSLSHLEVSGIARDPHNPDRIFLGTSSQPHAGGLAAAGILFDAAVSEPADDRLAIVIGLFFVVAGFMAARYLTRQPNSRAADASSEEQTSSQ